jgi:hypothetical protein
MIHRDNGRTLRVKILNGTPKIRAKIRQYANVWTEYANLKLSFVNDADAEIRVNVDNSNQSWSQVGTGCLVVPFSRPTMNFGWLTESTSEEEFSRVITHEFGHAIGCIHEHQSPTSGIPWDRDEVYKYYMDSQGWTQAQVDVNIFQLYDRTTTQFSEFDSTSIMLYSVPASLTKGRSYSTPWNTHLSEADKRFISQVYPCQKTETGFFSTTELRASPDKTAVQRQIYSKPHTSTPDVIVGLSSLDLAPTTSVGVSAFADRVTSQSADILIEALDGTTLGSSAAVTWFKAEATFDGDFQVGQASTLDIWGMEAPAPATQATAIIPITFNRRYAQPPTVVVWLSGFELGHGRNWRLSATASDITARGFVLKLDAGGEEEDTAPLVSASASWVAFPPHKAGVSGGSFSTGDVEGLDPEEPDHRAVYQGQARLSNPSTFVNRGRPPSRVLVALSSFDMAAMDTLRLSVTASAVSTAWLDWNLETQGNNSSFYSASASYIALD